LSLPRLAPCAWTRFSPTFGHPLTLAIYLHMIIRTCERPVEEAEQISSIAQDSCQDVLMLARLPGHLHHLTAKCFRLGVVLERVLGPPKRPLGAAEFIQGAGQAGAVGALPGVVTDQFSLKRN